MVRLKVNKSAKQTTKKKAKPRKMRRGGGHSKGASFERAFCKELSKWWSNMEDDHFWRSSLSGGRATVRQGRTANSYGDVAAMTPLGRLFTDVVTLELKAGYPRADVLDLFCKPDGGVYSLWISQARVAQRAAKTKYWMLVHKRSNRTVPLVILPRGLFNEFMEAKSTRLRNPVCFLFVKNHEEIIITEWRTIASCNARQVRGKFKSIRKKNEQSSQASATRSSHPRGSAKDAKGA